MNPTRSEENVEERERRDGDVDVRRVRRGLRNLAFEIERDQKASELLESQRGNGSPGGPGDASPGVNRSRELKVLRRQVDQLRKAVSEVRELQSGRRRRRAD